MARTKVSAKFVADLAYATFCIWSLTQDLRKFRKSTAGKSTSKGAGPKAVPVKTLGTKRRYTCSRCAAASVKNLRDGLRRPQEEDEENGEEEENEVMSEDEQREEEPKKLAAPARRCVQSTLLTPPREPLIALPVAWGLTFCPTGSPSRRPRGGRRG